MPQFHVNSDSMQSSSAAVNASAQTMRQAVQTMQANLNNLRNSWQGGAATQFDSVITQWNTAQKQVESSLDSIQRALSQASIVYSDAEAQASRLFQ